MISKDKIFCYKCRCFINKYYFKKHLKSKKHNDDVVKNKDVQPIKKIKKNITLIFD